LRGSWNKREDLGISEDSELVKRRKMKRKKRRCSGSGFLFLRQ
jgi:hypothetical protein